MSTGRLGGSAMLTDFPVPSLALLKVSSANTSPTSVGLLGFL